ncbi:MAG: winged helix-turn-helix domain-containing protein, partial [Thermoanaerobaculia bacterium]|nr:winged helix-turn-helix domain-containing protein [Thermoanaerobaculia bacterium]
MAEKTSPSRFLVGDLRVDFERGEIQRGDEVCRLGGQPLAILSVLLRSPSHSVSREELHGLLWPEQSFGDLDQRLNAAIRLLRRSLGDSTEGPRYLETLRGRGYRICAPVEVLPVPKTGDAEPSLPRLATPVLLVLGLVLLGFLASNRTREPVVTESRPLRLAVSPLEVIGSDAETETLAAVLDEQLKTRLTVLAPRRVELLGPSSSERFASDRGVWLGEAVDWLLEGKLVRAVESRRLFLHLHSIADSSIAWSSEMDASRPIALWFPELAQALTEVMGLSSLKSARTDPGTSVAGAYGGYLAAM